MAADETQIVLWHPAEMAQRHFRELPTRVVLQLQVQPNRLPTLDDMSGLAWLILDGVFDVDFDKSGVAALVTAALDDAAEAAPLCVPPSEAIDCLSLQDLPHGSRVYTVNNSPALYSEAMLRECYVTRGRALCTTTNERVVAVWAHTLHTQAADSKITTA